MKLKSEPIKPELKDFWDSRTEIANFSIGYELDGKLTDIIKQLQEVEDKFPGCTATVSYDHSSCYYEGDTPDVKLKVFTIITAKKQYQDALNDYKVKKAQWDKWNEENREEIAEELKNRALKQKRNLQKQLDKLIGEIEDNDTTRT